MWFGFERESLMEWFKFMLAREIEDGRFELAGGERPHALNPGRGELMIKKAWGSRK